MQVSSSPAKADSSKLAPVMQEGGTFVCDEEVLGQSFVCKGMVESGAIQSFD
ncbi:MAG: hypothetical protein AB2L26_00805 [Ignavibacteria bacterium]